MAPWSPPAPPWRDTTVTAPKVLIALAPASGSPSSPPPGTPQATLAPVAGFVCLPRAVLRARGLSRDAKLLYALLRDYARQDGQCFPGTARLRADLGCGHNQLARALGELEAAGL